MKKRGESYFVFLEESLGECSFSRFSIGFSKSREFSSVSVFLKYIACVAKNEIKQFHGNVKQTRRTT